MSVEQKKQEMAHLLCCTVLYFICQVFANLWDFNHPFIQKQLNYQHYPYYPPCLQVTCGPPEKLSLAHSAHDCETCLYLFNDFLWNCLRHRCINKARQDSIASNTMSVINKIKHMSIRQSVSNEKFQWLRRKQGK